MGELVNSYTVVRKFESGESSRQNRRKGMNRRLAIIAQLHPDTRFGYRDRQTISRDAKRLGSLRVGLMV